MTEKKLSDLENELFSPDFVEEIDLEYDLARIVAAEEADPPVVITQE